MKSYAVIGEKKSALFSWPTDIDRDPVMKMQEQGNCEQHSLSMLTKNQPNRPRYT